MAKSSFVKPGAAPAKPTAPAAKPAPGARPTPGKPAGNVPPAKAGPPPKPTPGKREVAATPPPGVRSNARPAPRKAPTPEPEPEPEVVEEEQVAEEVVEERGEETALAIPDEGGGQVGNLMNSPIGQIQGELDAYDFDIPRFQLCQSTGPLFEELGFTPGDWVAAQQIILWQDGCGEVEVTVLRVVKKFMESLPYGSEIMPRSFNTIEEANAAGLSLWGDDGAKCETQADALIMVKLPEGVTDESGEVFGLEYGDARYAMLLWRITGVAYGKVMKKLTGALRTRLRGGLHTGSFLVSGRKEKGKLNTYWVPVLDPGNDHDEEFMQFLLENAGEATA